MVKGFTLPTHNCCEEIKSPQNLKTMLKIYNLFLPFLTFYFHLNIKPTIICKEIRWSEIQIVRFYPKLKVSGSYGRMLVIQNVEKLSIVEQYWAG